MHCNGNNKCFILCIINIIIFIIIIIIIIIFTIIIIVIIHMKKLLDFDWLRAVQKV